MTIEFVPTSIARRIIARIHTVHERRRIGVFAGPPGIGKTTAIDVLERELTGSVVVVKIGRRNARPAIVLQHILQGLRVARGSPARSYPTSVWEMRSYVFDALCAWAGVDVDEARCGRCPIAQLPPLTLIFDEAQNLSRDAIEALRFWNDADRCYAPFPVGLVFVGNNEFSLQTDFDGRSVISAAVADRALYVQTFDYSDVTDDDVRLYLDARGVVGEAALQAVIEYLHAARMSRSFRRIENLVQELLELANGRPVTASLVRDVVALV